jgi:HD-GYP domain-containing protein (c-di-GMP phosphodiesterase class II)
VIDDTANSEDIATGPGADDSLHGRLSVVREALLALGGDRELLIALESVSTAVDQIAAEHAGMADELLSAYEQLGAVFEITRSLPGVQSESAVIELFVDSLSRSFAGRDVFVVREPELSPVPAAAARASHPPGLNAVVARARDGNRVLVEPLSDFSAHASAEEVMVGPVFAGDIFVCAIVLSNARSSAVRTAQGAPATAVFCTGDMQLLESLTMFCGDLIRNHRLVAELREMSVAMVRSLVNTVDQKDNYTCGHSLRVAYYATMLGRALSLTDADLQMLQWSALLHDVGKIGIRDSVLKKEGKLTTEEFAHIKEHPTRSHRVVQEVPQLAAALDGVLHHHERFDGTGYPHGLAGESIPLQARIIQIADIFDALTSDRSYRSAHTWERALDILREEAGKTVDPNLRVHFDRLIRRRIEDDPGGWEGLVAAASRFTQAFERCN